MPGLSVKVVLQDIKKINTEALIVVFYENVRPLKGLAGQLDWLLCGALSHLIIENKLRGSLGDVALITSAAKVPAQKIFMIGLGPRETCSPETISSAASAAVSSALSAGVKEAAMEYVPPAVMPFDSGVHALKKGLLEGAGNRQIDISVLAPDAAVYAEISKLIYT